jgi:NADH:ubiquinone oxidoreductase subunit 5 (subunit L)/multisubunit Na+/H+ antiporter MnhA subunit
MLIGSYSIAGLPYLSGFYSKDFLIENIIMSYFNSFFYSNNSLVSFILILSLTTVLITALYSFKSIIDIYYLSFRGFIGYVKNVHYSSYYIQIPLSLLCVATVYSGFIFQECMIGINTDFLSKSMWVSSSSISNLINDSNYDLYNLLKDFNHNNYLITEFFPYYRFYIQHILIYTLVIFLVIKI